MNFWILKFPRIYSATISPRYLPMKAVITKFKYIYPNLLYLKHLVNIHLLIEQTIWSMKSRNKNKCYFSLLDNYKVICSDLACFGVWIQWTAQYNIFHFILFQLYTLYSAGFEFRDINYCETSVKKYAWNQKNDLLPDPCLPPGVKNFLCYQGFPNFS